MPETTPDVEQETPQSKFGQMEFDFTGAKRAEPTPDMSWGQAQEFAKAGGFTLTAAKGNIPKSPFDFSTLNQVQGNGWEIKLQTPDNNELGIADIQKLTGDASMTWNKLIAASAVDAVLKLPAAPPAPEAPVMAPVAPVAWGAAQQFAKDGGYTLTAAKGNLPKVPFDHMTLDDVAGNGWEIKLQTPDNKELGIDDIKKLTGDDSMTWGKLLSPGNGMEALKLPAPPAPAENVAPVTNGPAEVAVEDTKNKGPQNTMSNAPDTNDAEEERERQRKAALKTASEGTLRTDSAPRKPIMTDDNPEDEMSEDRKMSIARARAAFQKNGFLDIMNEGKWNIGEITDTLKEALEDGEVRANRKHGLDFVRPNGHKIEWHENMGGAEFIGMTRKTKNFDLDDAKIVVAASKSRGWKAISVHGSPEQRDMMWLEAQRQGIEVANHTPSPNSEYLKKWKEEQAAKKEMNVGAAPADLPAGDQNMNMDGGNREMSPPAQAAANKGMGQFVNAEAMEKSKAAPPVDNRDIIEQYRDFLDQQEKMAEAKGDKGLVDKIQQARNQLDGKEPSMKELDPALAQAAKNGGVQVPDIVNGAGNPNLPGEKKDMATPTGNLTLSQYLDREIGNDKNSPDVVSGLKEMKEVLASGKMKQDDIDAIQFNRSMDNGGGVTRQQFDSIAEGITKALPDAKITRPADTAFPKPPSSGKNTVIMGAPAA